MNPDKVLIRMFPICPSIRINIKATGPRIGIPPAIPAIVFTTVAITLVARPRAKRRE